MITVLAFLLTLAVLIVVHEWGHYRMALACGVKVLRFSIGFGRVVWRRQRSADHTEFVLSALPLGGYVRMLDEREGEVAASELNQAFNRKSLLQRSLIVAAGPVANLLLAIVLFAASHWIGVDEVKAVLGAPASGSVAERAGMQSGDWVQAWQRDDGQWAKLNSINDLRWQLTEHMLRGEPLLLQVSHADGRGRRELRLALDELGARELDAALLKRIGLGAAYSDPVFGEIKQGPAATAGLRSGDRVLTLDGLTVPDARTLLDRIRQSGHDGQARTLLLQVLRDGQALTVEVKPRIAKEGDQTIARIDAAVVMNPERIKVRLGVLDGLRQGAAKTWDLSMLTLRMMGRMLVGQASLRNLSGPITIADVAGQSVQQGPAYYLAFLAMVSVSLGVLNLLPLPMLDGGHLMYYLFEGLTGRPVSDLWLARLQRGGIAVLLLMMSVALFNDVARLMGLH
jgi:regulator of sigma E protease